MFLRHVFVRMQKEDFVHLIYILFLIKKNEIILRFKPNLLRLFPFLLFNQ
jgi:hypothetical protein